MSNNWQTNDIIGFFAYHGISDNKYIEFLLIHKINGNLMDSYIDSIIKDMGLFDKISKKLFDEVVEHWKQISLKKISPSFALKTPKVMIKRKYSINSSKHILYYILELLYSND